LEGIAVTADPTTGLRAWDLKTKQLMAQVRLQQGDSCALPSCMALDDQNLQQKRLDIAVGFTDGSFGTWQLHIEQKQIARRYRHEGSSSGEIVGVSFLYPYLLTATKSVLISVYTFDRPPPSNRLDCCEEAEADSEREKDIESEILQESDPEPYAHVNPSRQDVPKDILNDEEVESHLKPCAPYLLTSLRSHTTRAPLALSLRKTAGSTVASIAYTFSTIRGWSLGIQELHIRPTKSRLDLRPEITTTQLAYTLPVQRTSTPMPSPPSSPARQSELHIEEYGQFDGPISLSYTHPYLLATLPDNTLVLHRCTSSSSSLSISPGIRLWGHTSGISDAEITARGKAVSVSSRGEEIRVWELEGRTNGRSVEVRPITKSIAEDAPSERLPQDHSAVQWDDRRNWVGFDDEMVIVLKESSEGRESLLVYDFT
jgi:WD40 repeat protein